MARATLFVAFIYFITVMNCSVRD